MQILVFDDTARFTHKSVMEYFIARLLYEILKSYKPPINLDFPETGTQLQDTYFNDMLIAGCRIIEESAIMQFIKQMIQNNGE